MQLAAKEHVDSIARALQAAGYSVEGVRARIGSVASEALGRNAVVPARRALADDESDLGLLTRLFLLGDRVLLAALTNVIDPTATPGLFEGEREIRSTLEIAPYAVDSQDWFIASDWGPAHTGRPADRDHVLGVGGASTMLAQCTVRPVLERALDVGTGCGVQALHLAQHAAEVVATDVSDRCLVFAQMNAWLNDVDLDVRLGSCYEPVAGERFDLIVSNPPFVVGSPSSVRHTYRDTAVAGGSVCSTLVRRAETLLSDGGFCQLLANWEITDGDDWALQPRDWLADSGLDAWVIQREVQDPAAYVETWLRDAGDHRRGDYELVYDSWLGELAHREVIGVGFGLISLRRGEREKGIRRFQHAGQAWQQPVGPEVVRWFAAQDVLSQHAGAEILLQRWSCSDDVEVLSESAPGASQPHGRSIRRSTGMAWDGPIDEFGVALLGAADGAAQLGELIVELATGGGLNPQEALTAAVPRVRQLVAEGFLVLR